MRVNGEAIADVEFSEIYDRVERTAQQLLHSGKLPWHPSFFEMLTVMAFEYFASVGVEIAVLEVGMGGRLDATNVVDPLLSVIADISLDHQKYLGDTIGEIAREKAGIIRENGLVVTLPQHPEANDVIGHAILDHHATGISAVKYVPPVSPGSRRIPGGTRRPGSRAAVAIRSACMGEEILVDSPLAGRHQLRNIALAIAAAEELGRFGFKVYAAPDRARHSRDPLAGPLSGACRPRPPRITAHHRARCRAQSCRRLGTPLHTLRNLLPTANSPSSLERWRDKAMQEMADILFPIAQHVVVTHIDNPRAATTDQLLQAGSRTGTPMVAEQSVAVALARAGELTSPEGVIVVTGSIFLVGDTMKALGIPA